MIYKKAYSAGLITKDINHFRTKIKSDSLFEVQAKRYDQLKKNMNDLDASMFSSWRQDQYGELLGVIILFLAFGLRYLIYAIKWSTKQLS